MSERASDFNVFISWSGELSKKVAYAVQNWLSVTIQAAKPFVSEKDIDAGDRGLQEIEHQLDRVKVGIFCLTSQNLSSPWLHFEAGAVSKKFGDKSYVIPLLFDVESHQVKQPLAQFQWKRFTQEDMASVARTVNKSLGTLVDETTLTNSLEWNWSRFEESIQRIRLDASQQELIEQPKRTVEDMLEEVVVTLREHSQILNDLDIIPPRQTIVDYHLNLITEALKKLAEKHKPWGTFQAKQLSNVQDKLDQQDWDLIETAPFLLFYAERYLGMRRPSPYGGYGSTAEDGEDPLDLNKVPF